MKNIKKLFTIFIIFSVAVVIFSFFNINKAQAALLFSDNFEYVADDGNQVAVSGPWLVASCANCASMSNIRTITSIPGYSGSMPSGTRALRMFSDSYDRNDQTIPTLWWEAPLGTNWWLQTWIYLQNYQTGDGSTQGQSPELSGPLNDDNRGIKFLYPRYNTRSWMNFINYTMDSGGTATRYYQNNPNSIGISYLYEGWGWGLGDQFYDANLIENGTSNTWIPSNQWALFKLHVSSVPGQKKLEAWVDLIDSNGFQKIADYTPNFTDNLSWSSSGDNTHAFCVQSPAIGGAVNRNVWLYFDDFYVATLESDLPTYGAGDTIPPTVSITAPANGATVSGTAVTVSASASDNVGVIGVQFRIDGVNLGSEDITSPYSITWDTTTASNGSHTLTAIARDAAGNQTTSSAVAVTVNNDTTPPAPPTGVTVS